MTFKNAMVTVDRDDVKLPKNAYYICDIIGSTVVDEAGNKIGILEDVMENPAQPIYVVKGDTEHLIPGIPEFILSTDAENRIITVRLIEGM
jgi:RimM protein, required for 16S rRNA processing